MGHRLTLAERPAPVDDGRLGCLERAAGAARFPFTAFAHAGRERPRSPAPRGQSRYRHATAGDEAVEDVGE
jgi:hypothetical protein